jgi:hypothetical protein
VAGSPPEQGNAQESTAFEPSKAAIAGGHTGGKSNDLKEETPTNKSSIDSDTTSEQNSIVEDLMAQVSTPQSLVLGTGVKSDESDQLPPPPPQEEDDDDEEESLEQMKMMITNKDTGEVFHLDSVDDHTAPETYNLFASRAEIDAQQAQLAKQVVGLVDCCSCPVCHGMCLNYRQMSSRQLGRRLSAK